MTRTTVPDRYAAVFHHLREAVFLCGPDVRVVDVNPAATELTGYSADELVGHLHGELDDPGLAADRAAALRAHLSAHAQWTGDVPFRRSEGEMRIGRTTWPRLAEDDEVTGYLAITRDVTEELTTAVMLSEAELRWRLTIDAAPIGIALVGLEGHFVRVNPKLCEIVGYSDVDLLSRT